MVTDDGSLLALLRSEHAGLHRALDELAVAKPGERPERLRALVKNLVRHELAEEVVVYPAARAAGAIGPQLAEARLDEQHLLDGQLLRLERNALDAETFESVLTAIETNVRTHTVSEERSVLEPLERSVSPERLRRLRYAYEVVRDATPAHPYPPPTSDRDVVGEGLRRAVVSFLLQVRDAVPRGRSRNGSVDATARHRG
jgi:hypothetical protein